MYFYIFQNKFRLKDTGLYKNFQQKVEQYLLQVEEINALVETRFICF